MGAPDSPNGQEKSFLGGFGMEFRNFNPNGLTSGICFFPKCPWKIAEIRNPQFVTRLQWNLVVLGVLWGIFRRYVEDFLEESMLPYSSEVVTFRFFSCKIIWCNVTKNLSGWYFQVCCNRLICLVVGHWNPVYFDRRKDLSTTQPLQHHWRVQNGCARLAVHPMQLVYTTHDTRCKSCTSFRMFFS